MNGSDKFDRQRGKSDRRVRLTVAAGQAYAKRGGRPTTWVGGGGIEPRVLAQLGVPRLRGLFLAIFGEPTASNNAAWLRRKLAERPDSTYGQGRCERVRARDASAAIFSAEAGCDDDSSGGAGSAAGGGWGDDDSASYEPPRGSSTGGMLSARSAPAGGGFGGVKRRPPPRRGESLGVLMEGCETLPGAFAAAGTYERVPLDWPTLAAAATAGAPLEVFWPDDECWWAATVLQFDAASRSLSLLYPNLQEECISGEDLEQLIQNGHLAAPVRGHYSPGGVPATPSAAGAAGALEAGSPSKRHRPDGGPLALSLTPSSMAAAAASAGNVPSSPQSSSLGSGDAATNTHMSALSLMGGGPASGSGGWGLLEGAARTPAAVTAAEAVAAAAAGGLLSAPALWRHATAAAGGAFQSAWAPLLAHQAAQPPAAEAVAAAWLSEDLGTSVGDGEESEAAGDAMGCCLDATELDDDGMRALMEDIGGSRSVDGGGGCCSLGDDDDGGLSSYLAAF